MNIGWAIDTMKSGGKVRRGSWGESFWVVLQKGYPKGIPINANTAEATGIPEGTVMRFHPYLMLHVPDGDGMFAPWIAGNSDLLAEDWERA
jgi:hypothetical protein